MTDRRKAEIARYNYLHALWVLVTALRKKLNDAPFCATSLKVELWPKVQAVHDEIWRELEKARKTAKLGIDD